MKIREWMEGQKWYWFTIQLSYNVFPWHWQKEFVKDKWGFIAKFGPFGLLVIWE